MSIDRGRNVILPDDHIPNGSKRGDRNAFLNARNGAFTELVRIRRLDDVPANQPHWKTAIRVSAYYFYDPQTEYFVYESSDRGFPMADLKDDSNWHRLDRLPKIDVTKVDLK